jgi:hypothetical protein
MKPVKLPSFLLGLLLIFFCFQSFAFAEPVSGIVYNDKNRNGVLDKREKGVRNVAVSNGSTVVLTDKKGRYKIDIKTDEILFISKPSGYALELDEDNIPQSFYIHSPGGTPEKINLRYPGLIPSGELNGDINFPVYKYKEPDKYDVLLVSDPQTATNEELGYFRDRIVSELAGEKAAFGITAGDIVQDDLSLYPRYKDILAQAGIPWFNIPGNHDINYLAPDDSRSLETFKRNFGPSYYSFNWGKAHYIVLDTVFYNGTDPEKKDNSGGYLEKLDEKQLKWLKKDIAIVPKDRLIVLAMHIPIDFLGDKSFGGPIVNRKELLELLSDYENIFAIAGHMHTTQHVYLDDEDGYSGEKPLHQHIITTAAGTWWSGAKDITGIPHSTQIDGTPNGYHIMSVRGNRCSVSYKAADKPSDYQMRITLEKQNEKKLVSSIPISMIKDFQIVVNLFDGGENSTVSCRIDNGKLFSLNPDNRVDTFAFKSYENTNSFISGQEIPSTHIWSGSFNQDINPGAHTVTVLAIDEYGREHYGRKIFEVVDDDLKNTEKIRKSFTRDK